MDAIEKAIRNAFEKGDAEDRAFREKVYRSAFAALDRAMQARQGLTVEAAINQRKSLQAKVASIESEFLLAVSAGKVPGQPRPEAAPTSEAPPVAAPARNGAPAAPFVEAPVTQSGSAYSAAPAVQVESAPAVQAGRVPEAPAELDIVPEPPTGPSPPVDVGVERAAPLAGAAAIDEVAPDRNDARANEMRRPYAAVFFAVTLITATAIGGWWAYQTGLLKLPSELDTSVPNPPQTVEEEDFIPEEEAATPSKPGDEDQQRNWVTVFSPDDPSLVNAPAGAAAEVSQDESGSFLRIRSGSADAAIVFDVGQGILEQIAGRKAVFDIVARAEGGKETQISVDCDFGELGDCGRKRYVVGYERGEYLFDVELPAKKPGAGGSIAINSDFANQGKAVDIYEIRVSVAK